jgi:hypothetical protein
MTSLKNIIISQKERLNDIIINYEKIINHINNTNHEVYNKETLHSLKKIDSKIEKIEKHFETLQYNFDISSTDNNEEVDDRIKDYEIEKIVFDTFTPYMIYLRLILDNYYRNISPNTE